MTTNSTASNRRPCFNRRASALSMRALTLFALAGGAVGCEPPEDVPGHVVAPPSGATCVQRTARLVLVNVGARPIVDAEIRPDDQQPEPRPVDAEPAAPVLTGEEVLWEGCVSGPMRLRVRTADGVEQEVGLVMGPALTVRASVTPAGIVTEPVPERSDILDSTSGVPPAGGPQRPLVQ